MKNIGPELDYLHIWKKIGAKNLGMKKSVSGKIIIYNKEKIYLDIISWLWIMVSWKLILIKYGNIEKYRMIEKESSNYTLYKIIIFLQ